MDLIEIGKRAILCGFVALIVGPGAFAQSKDDVYTPELIEGLDPAPLQNAITRLDKDVECNVRFVVDMSGVPAGISPNCNDPDLDAAAVQAVQVMRYEPKYVNGDPVLSEEIVLPIRIEKDRPGELVIEIVDRDAIPIKQPDQAPLKEAIGRIRKDARCEVWLDVNAAGVPENVRASCTRKGYEKAAFESVGAARFAPKIINGVAYRRTGVMYPIELSVASRSDMRQTYKSAECMSYKSTPGELDKLQELGTAADLRDVVRMEYLVSELDGANLYCPQHSIFLILKARSFGIVGDFATADDVMDELDEHMSSAPNANNNYAVAMRDIIQQWISFNLKAETGQFGGTQEAQLLIANCGHPLDKAYKKEKKQEVCAVNAQIDAKGLGDIVDNTCSSGRYAQAAVESVGCALFLPRVENGEAVTGPAVTFELEFDEQKGQ